jgi:hypothetical protein
LHEFCHTSIITKLLHGCFHTQIWNICGPIEDVDDWLAFWQLPRPEDVNSTRLK